MKLKGPHILSNVRTCKRHRTYKPNSVRRCRRDGHSSRPCIAAWLKRPTRRFGAPSRSACAVRRNSLPIWSCSVWGLPCLVHYCPSGALLPHLFTLIPPKAGRYVFCCTFRLTGLNPPSRTLSGTLLYGVRTFLSLLAKTATIRPDISILIINGF